jgi:hypothetical protein
MAQKYNLLSPLGHIYEKRPSCEARPFLFNSDLLPLVMLSAAKRSRSISSASLLAAEVSSPAKMLRLRYAALSMTDVLTYQATR